MPRLQSPEALASFREGLARERQAWPMRITLSGGTCGEASGSLAVLQAVRAQLEENGLTDEVHVRVTGCQGFCQQEPLLTVEPLERPVLQGHSRGRRRDRLRIGDERPGSREALLHRRDHRSDGARTPPTCPSSRSKTGN